MKIIISPAKNMKSSAFELTTKPIFLDNAIKIANEIKVFNNIELESLMKVNPKIAFKAFVDYQTFGETLSPAIFSYDGLVYKNINPNDILLNDKAAQIINDRVRILSALYGILKPLDNISSYRLDFMMNFKINDKNLYEYWGNSIYKELYSQTNIVINLASAEYSKLIMPFITKENVFINCEFLSKSNDKYIAKPTFVKMARGQLVAYIIKNNIKDIEGIKSFKNEIFSFSNKLSTYNKLVFTE